MANDYTDLSMAMFRTGILGYGGGPSIVPLIRHEAVIRYKWMEDEQFGEVLAVANALPGPIATKLAAYLGYKRKGTIGAVVAVLAHILPTCIAMVALLSVINYLSSSRIVAGIIAGVTPVIAVMLGTMAYEFAQKAFKGLGKTIGLATVIVSFMLLQALHLHAGIVTAIFLAYGAFHFKLAGRLKRVRESEGS